MLVCACLTLCDLNLCPLVLVCTCLALCAVNSCLFDFWLGFIVEPRATGMISHIYLLDIIVYRTKHTIFDGSSH